MVSALLLAAGPAAGEEAPAGLPPERPLHELTLKRWTVDDGLPTDALTNVLQTADGFLWLTTFNGLARFDGTRFEVFDKLTTPAFLSNGFHELAEGPGGDLWIGTQSGGVVVYRDGVFQPAVPDGRLEATVRSLLIDDAGAVWAGTGDFGAFRLEGSGWMPVAHPALTDVTVRDIAQGSGGAVWFATEGNGLVRLAGGVFEAVASVPGLASDAVTSLCEAADGGLWVGTMAGLSRLRPEGSPGREAGATSLRGAALEAVAELAGVEILRMVLDPRGNLWIAAEQGLIRRDHASGAFERLESLAGEPLRKLNAITFDREGGVWAASYAGGLFGLESGKFKNFTPESGLATERVNVLYQTAGGRVLAGGDRGRIDVIEGDVVRPLRLAEPMPDVRIRDLLQDRRGNLWIASAAGVSKIAAAPRTDGGKVSTVSGFPSHQARLVFEDRSGRIWVGTRGGGLIEVLEDGGLRTLDRSSGLISDFILSIQEGPGGELLLGTHEGLAILEPDGAIVNYGQADGVPGIVFSTLIDADGGIWLATNGGVSRLRRGEIRTVATAGGLPSEAVFDLALDRGGWFWLSTNTGVVKVSRRQLIAVLEGRRRAIEPVVYDDRDGMANRACTGAAKILEASDGKLWFPTLGGISVIDPNDLPVNRVPPPLTITRFAVDGEPLVLHGLEPDLELAPGTREVIFDFAALSFVAPSKMLVRYRLEGFDDDWIDAGTRRTVRYTSLPHGDYAFRVIAANNDRVWNSEGASLGFRIAPHFYQRPLFAVALAAAALAALRAFWGWRMRTVRARQALLESVIADKQRLLEELEAKNTEMERFNYTVSHDLKSPLVTIQGFLGMLEKDALAGDLERMKSDIGRIRGAAAKMSQLLEELLELSRVGRVAHEPQDVDLGALVAAAVERLTGQIEARGAEVVIAPDLPVVRGDPTRLGEVYQNLIGNAVQYMGDEPAPRVEVGVRPDGVLYVSDNGVGVEPRYHAKVFGLFERLDAGTEGTGIGLALVQRIVEVHGGRVWIESEGRGQGSTFCLTLGAAPSP